MPPSDLEYTPFDPKKVLQEKNELENQLALYKLAVKESRQGVIVLDKGGMCISQDSTARVLLPELKGNLFNTLTFEKVDESSIKHMIDFRSTGSYLGTTILHGHKTYKLDIHLFPHPKNQDQTVMVISESAPAPTQQTLGDFYAMFDLSPTAMSISDPQTRRFVRVNNAWVNLFGYSNQQVCGKTTKEVGLIDKESYDIIAPIFKQDGSSVHAITLTNAHGDDLDLYIQASVVSVNNEEFLLASAVDFTQINKIKKDLERSEQRWKFAIEGKYDGLWDWNIHTNEAFFSAQWKQMIGYDDEEISNEFREWETRLHPDDRDLAFQNIEDHLSGKTKIYSNVFRMQCKDGNYKWIHARGKVLEYDKSGNPLRMIGTHMDITKSKEEEGRIEKQNEELKSINAKLMDANQKLAVAEERFLQLSNHIDFIFWLREGGRIIYVNAALERICGIKIEDYYRDASTFSNLIHPDDKAQLFEIVQKDEFAVHGYLDVEYRIITPQNETKWIHVKSYPVLDENGKMVRQAGITEDITRRKEMEAAIQEASKFNETIINNCPVGIWLFNEAGDTIMVNDAAARLGGTEKEVLLSKNIKDFQSWKSGGLDKAFRESLDENIVIKKEIHIVNIFNREIWFEASLLPILFLNKKHLLVLTYDLFDLKKAEGEIIKAKERAEGSDRLKTQFLNNLSHEIRSPMNGIVGFAEFLNQPDLDQEKRQSYTRIIINSSYQLLRIIDDLLEISSLETRQVVAEPKLFSLNELLNDLYSIFSLRAKEKKLSLFLKRTLPEGEEHIFSDQSKLHKIISNLLENAIKFTPSGHVELECFLFKRQVIIEIRDSGIGIAPEAKERIFERFAQEDKEIAKSFGGLGLGLSIAKENAELLGGFIEFESTKGKGTTFRVTIPYHTGAQAHHEKPSAKLITEIRRILVVEDEEINYLYLETILKNEIDPTLDIIHARNGQESIDKCKNRSDIDLILLDIKLPDMNGYEVKAELDHLIPSVPVIAITAYASKSDKEKALNSGFIDHITKPFDQDDIRRAFERIS